MPAHSMVGRYVLIALRNLEAEARLEGQRGQCSPDLSMKWLDWLLNECHGSHGYAGLKVTWPPSGQERRDEAIIQLRDVDHLPFHVIATALGLERSMVIKAYHALKQRLSPML